MFLKNKKYLEIFKLAVENAFEHILVTDEKGVIVYANKAAEVLTEYKLEEMVGKKPGDLWGGHMEKDFYKRMWRQLRKKKKPFVGEIKNHKKSGKRYDAEIKVAPALDKNKNILYFIGVERDITQMKEANRLRAELISMASHELKSPITAMKWNMELIFDSIGKTLSAKDKKTLGQVSQVVENMNKLVNSLLNVSRIQTGTFSVDPEQVNFSKLCQDVLEDFLPMIKKKKIKLVRKNFIKRGLELKVDYNLTKIIFHNLISNAVKYTPERGKIHLSFEKLDTGGLLFKVLDSGMGIPKKQQKNIFKKMFRADNVRDNNIEGTGLGLYIVKSIISQVGGKVWFESEENKGNNFVRFPKSGMKKKKGTRKLA